MGMPVEGAGEPGQSLKRTIIKGVGEGNAEFVDATRIATALMGDSIATNMFMLGYALQKGLVPVSSAAINKAIELNGAAVQMNQAAFLWGRRAATDLAAVERLVAPKPETVAATTMSQTLEEMIARRFEFLTGYQNAAYAERYGSLVERMKQAENAKAKGHRKRSSRPPSFQNHTHRGGRRGRRGKSGAGESARATRGDLLSFLAPSSSVSTVSSAPSASSAAWPYFLISSSCNKPGLGLATREQSLRKAEAETHRSRICRQHHSGRAAARRARVVSRHCAKQGYFEAVAQSTLDLSFGHSSGHARLPGGAITFFPAPLRPFRVPLSGR
jgi:uncharacterized protein DUF6537